MKPDKSNQTSETRDLHPETVPGQLYVVATPIGNLEDLSPRAKKVLSQVDLIACEDTRHTRRLLTHFAIETACTSYHEHNEEMKAQQLVSKIKSGKDIALVSDAGTPLLSDPGYRLVKACREVGIRVTPIPGPFAGAAAVSVSGLPTDKVLFLGFLPKKKGALKKSLEEVSQVPATLVLYLSPHHLPQTLINITECLGNRPAFLIREMTKLYETVYSGTLDEISRNFQEEDQKGEFTLVVSAAVEAPESIGRIDTGAYVLGLMQKHSISSKEAISLTVDQLGKPKKEVYQAFLETKK